MALKVIIFLIAAVVLSMSLLGCTKETSSDVQITNENNSEGKLLVKVYDKTTKEPVNDAKITVVGMSNIYKTNDNGLSPEIILKINKDFYKKYGDNLSKKAPAGSATVIVEKDGYKDYIVFNKPIYPGYGSNSLNIELTKLGKSDKQKYVADVQRPHDVWIEELIESCKNINEVKNGDGENKVSISIKDANKKPVEGAALIIPELSIKGLTDKNGKVVLKPGVENSSDDIYPVEKGFSEFTMVTIKEGYKPEVLMNVAVYSDKENNINITLEPDKDKSQGTFTVSCLPADSAWVEKLIDSHKETGTE